MSIVLDTGVLWRPPVLRRAAARDDEIILPAVVFAERARQLVQRGVEPGEFLAWLRRSEFVVESFGIAQALRRAVRVTDDRLWKRASRDALVAGHVGEGDELWTTNPSDFIAIGVPERQIVAVP